MTRLFERKLIKKSSKLSLQRPSITNREHSSAGSEHLPYKQRVRGSNPFAPTENEDDSKSSFFCFVRFRDAEQRTKSSFCFLCLWSCASTRHCRNKQKPAALLFISALSAYLAASIGIKNEVSKYLRRKRLKRQKRRKGWLGQRR